MDTVARLSTLLDATVALPLSGIVEGTNVRTLDGVLPVEYLEPGDRIVTRSGARRLVAVSVQRRRFVDLVRIRASTLGHDRPDSDLLVAPGQLVLVRDWRARALYGCDIAAIPALRLVDGEFVLREVHRTADGPVSLYTLRFDTDETIWAAGLELACPSVSAPEVDAPGLPAGSGGA
jgi:hypothetical protein